ncbi:hypothetical protein V6N12_034394 [Hibiscus sabdariffa]|uniref:Bulb-type lectin domain-containing protein n=1 Tax=Hibiscus sabdariffa TaxID=183260 RepID=A0ABR2AKW5_9ROSI
MVKSWSLAARFSRSGFSAPVVRGIDMSASGIFRFRKKTVVWVANRDNPIKDNSGNLRIDSRGNLALFQRNRTLPVWSTNISVTGTRNTIAQILDSGNLVLVQNDTRRAVVWQSFDYPTNTLLPFMKLGLSFRTGLNRVITSWKSPDDPGIGNFSYRINPSGFPQLYLYKGSAPSWRTGSWTGRRWSGVPEMTSNYIFHVSFVNTADEVSVTYGVTHTSFITRMVTNETGIQQRYTWNRDAQHWIGFWSAPEDQCDFYGHCGPNGGFGPVYKGVLFNGKEIAVKRLSKHSGQGRSSQAKRTAVIFQKIPLQISSDMFGIYGKKTKPLKQLTQH